jgi:hypothetical protein
MKKFYRLLDDVNVPNRWHLGEIFEVEGTSLELWHGIARYSEKPLTVKIDRSGKSLDFCMTSFAIPVAKTPLGHAIGAIAGPDLQRISVMIDGFRDYEVLNSVRIIGCLDEANSIFTKWTPKDHRHDLAGQYRMVTKLVLDPKRVPSDCHFFRLEGWHIALIVSQDVRRAMEDAGCLGALFQDV